MAETDIELKVGLDNKDAVQRSKELQNEIQRTFNKIDTSKMNASTKASINKLNKLSEKASEIQKKMEALSGDAINTEEYHKLQEELEKANTNFDHALDRQEALEQSGHATTEQITAARAETDRWAETISSIQERMSALESSSGGLKENVPTAEYKELQDELEKLNASFDTALDKQQALEESEWGHPDQIKAAREETDKWADSIEEVRQKMAAMEEAGTAYEAPKGASEEYSKLESQLEDVNNQMDVQLTRQQQMEDGFRRLRINSNNAFGRIFNQFSDGAYQVHQMAQGIQNFGPAIQGAMSGATTGFAAFNSIAGAAIPIIGGITTVAGLLITAISKLVEAIQKAIQAMAELQGRMAKTLVNSVPILKQVVGMVTNPKATIQNLGRFGKQLGGALKKLLSSAVGILKSGISKAVGDIKSSISEGIGALEQWQIAMGNTSNSISALKGSLDLLKMNIGAAFAPILDAAAPALLQLTSILNQATITIGSFFAALGGKTKILVAKSATASLTNASTAAGDVASAAEDSTDSLGNSYQALEKVGKGADTAAGKLNNFLGSYDELNVIGQESGGGGGASGGADLSANFEEIEIGEDILEFAEKVREAWEKADFTGLGKEIGQKLIGVLNEADEWINKNGIPFAEKFGKSLATLINGFVTAKELDENGNETGRTIGQVIGQTIADGIEMVLTGMESFLSTINAPEVGQFVVDIIKKFLDPDEGGNNKTMWDSLGNVIVLGINKAIEFGNTLLDPKNDVFQRFGERVRDLIKKAVEGDGENGEGGIDFSGLGTLIANGISSAVEGVLPLLQDNKLFYNLGTNLGISLNSMQEGLDDNNTWEKLGYVLSDGFEDVFLTLGGFLDTWNPQSLADGIAKAINTAIRNISADDATYFTVTLSRLVETLLNTLNSILSQVDTQSLGETLGGAIEGIDVGGMITAFTRLSHTIVSKLLDTLISMMTKFKQDGYFKQLGAQLYDGVHSVDWGDVWDKIKQLLGLGLNGLWDFVKGWFGRKFGLIKGDVGPQAVDAGKVVSDSFVKGTIDATTEGLSGWPNTAVNERVKSVGVEVSTQLETFGQGAGKSFADGTVNATNDGLKDWPNNTVSTQLQNAETVSTESAKTTGENIGNSLSSGAINTTEEKLKDWPNSIVSENLKTANTTADTKIDEIKKTITGGLEKTKTESNTIFTQFQGIVTKTFGDTKTEVSNKVEETQKKVVEEVTTMRDKVVGTSGKGGLVKDIKDGTTEGFEDINTSVNGQDGSMPKLKQGVSDTVSEIQADTVEKVGQMSTDTQKAYEDMKNKTVGTDGSFTQMKDEASTIAAGMKTNVSKEVSDLGTNVETSTSEDIKQVTIEAFEEMAKKVVGDSENDTSAIIPKIKDIIVKCFDTIKTKVVGENGSVPDLKKKITDAFNELQSKLVGADGNGGIMNVIKISIIGAATNMKTSLLEQYNEAQSNLKTFVNNSITYINRLIVAYNALRAAMAMAGVGGGGTPTPAVPHLAQGAVIPPNQPFLAMLGDQKSGTNIEAPLSTIQEAVANVLEPYLVEIANNTAKTAEKDLTVRIGDRDIARSATRGQKMMGLKIRTV